jgi:transcriptional regulator with XRE-family HTH domain
MIAQPQLQTASSNIGVEIRTKRHAHGWTQKELARRAGLHHVTVSKIEMGKSANEASIEALITTLNNPNNDHNLATDEREEIEEATKTDTVTAKTEGHTSPSSIPKDTKPIRSQNKSKRLQNSTTPTTSGHSDITIPGSLVAYAVNNSLDLGDVMTLLRIARAAGTRTADGEVDWEVLSKVIDDIFT